MYFLLLNADNMFELRAKAKPIIMIYRPLRKLIIKYVLEDGRKAFVIGCYIMNLTAL